MRTPRHSAAARVLFAFAAAMWLSTAAAAAGYRLSTGKPVPALSYGAASSGWAGAVGGVAGAFSAGELAAMPPGLRTSLPALAQMNPESPAALRSLGPVAYNIEKALEIPLDKFREMSPASRKEVVAMALEDSIRVSEEAAYDLVAEAHRAMYGSKGGTPGEALIERMERVQREFGPWLGDAAREKLAGSYRDARRRLAEAKSSRLRETMGRTAAALAPGEPELLFTRQFSGDAKHFREDDWRRLGREYGKLSALLRSNAPRKGEIGNVKFLGGPLAGIGEFKFGAGRTHRIYFRYRPEDDAVALLHYAPREHANNPARVYDKVRGLVESGADADAIPPSPEIRTLMAPVEESDLNALTRDVRDLPGPAEEFRAAAKAPEERAAPPSPVLRPSR